MYSIDYTYPQLCIVIATDNQSQYIHLHVIPEVVELLYNSSVSDYTINQLIVILRIVIETIISN